MPEKEFGGIPGKYGGDWCADAASLQAGRGRDAGRERPDTVPAPCQAGRYWRRYWAGVVPVRRRNWR